MHWSLFCFWTYSFLIISKRENSLSINTVCNEEKNRKLNGTETSNRVRISNDLKNKIARSDIQCSTITVKIN